ncbi:MAG: YciI family protein [Alphaproteobacteria bacterium]
MPYAIIAQDRPDATEIRRDKRPDHFDYLEANKHLLLAAGAQFADDGTTPVGSILLIDVDDRAAAEAFARNDPFNQAGLFESIKIVPWRKVFFDGERVS